MPKILIVEDNEPNRDMLSRRLAYRGYEVHTAVDGYEGVEKTIDLRPDLVLMDVSLPVLPGYEAARRLKEDERTSEIPIIALTAHALGSDREAALAAGCDDFDTKPVEIERLVQKIARLINL